jgi:methionyl-tRNA synthetase
MESRRRFYVTTPIYYANDAPHIGSAYPTIAADILARFHRLRGEEVLFSTGTDENSAKVAAAAREKGLTRDDFLAGINRRFQEAWSRLNIAYDDYIRTSEPRQHRAVQHFFRTLQENGDIYTGVYEGWYCVHEETFFTPEEVVREEGSETPLCPECRRPVQWVQEENYFFALSRYGDRLLAHIEANPEFLQPDFRRNEVIAFIKEGLRDIAITRHNDGYSIPVPDDPSHVIYVWFDALINYITVAGYPDDPERFARWWPASVHLVGKDIFVRFHCTLWPAMLMAARLPLPERVFGHGFWMNEGQRMSKSRGNFINPMELADELARLSGAAPPIAVDAIRYFLFREMPFGADGDFSRESLLRRFNSDLANDLGNALNRTLPLIARHCGGVIPDGADGNRAPGVGSDPAGASADAALATLADSVGSDVEAALERIDYTAALAAIWRLIGGVNKYVDDQAPWGLAKAGDQERLAAVLYTVLEGVRIASVLVTPFMPAAAAEIQRQLGLTEEDPRDWAAGRRWGGLRAGACPTAPAPIFPRIDLKAAGLTSRSASRQATGAQETPSIPPLPKNLTGRGEEGLGSTITLDDFARIELRVARVLAAERVPKADKLLQLQVDLGDHQRTVLAGVAEYYVPEQLVGRNVVLIANLEPRKIRGIVSHGMLLAADADGTVSLLMPDKDLPPGSKVR